MDDLYCPLEIRQDETRSGPGRLYGTLITYGEQAGDRREVFAPGALQWPESGIVVNLQHDRQQPVTRVIPEQRGNAVVIDTPLPDTQRGRDAATLIRNGTFTGLSLEFQSRSEGVRGGIREIRSAFTPSAAIVDSPSYKGSHVEVRKRRQGRQGRLPLVWL